MRPLIFAVSVFLFALCAIGAGTARANCTNPAGTEGTITFNGVQHVPQVCTGTQWVALGVLNPSGGSGNCSNPSGPEGQILYNGDSHVPQYCDGTNWRAMVGRVAMGILGFTDLTGQSTSTLVTSNIIQATKSGSISISGNGSPAYRICADGTCSGAPTFTSSSGTLTSGEFLQLELTSSASNSTLSSATVTVGTGNTTWNVTTVPVDPCAGSPSPGTVCADGTIYAGLSPDGNVPMYTTAADEGGFPWNNGNTSGYTTTNQTSTTTGMTNTTNLLTIDSDSNTAGTQPHLAAQQCANSTANGHTDWYLPAKDELNVLCTNELAIGGFNLSGSIPVGYYWSSSETSSTNAWFQSFSDCSQSKFVRNKDVNLSIRCVRK